MSGKYVGLVLIFVIVLGVAGIAFRLLSAEGEGVKTFGDVSPLGPEVVDRVVMRDAEQQTIVVKRDGGWWVDAYPAIGVRMETLWETASRIGDAELVATNSTNHDLMGVHPDNHTVLEFWSGGEVVERFIVGDKQFAPVGERVITPWTATVRLCYLRRPDEVEVYALFCEFPEPFGTDANYWRDPIVAAVPPDEIESVTFSYADESFSVRLINSVWSLESEEGSEPASIEAVSSLLAELRQVVTGAFPTEEEAAGLNWEEPHAIISVGVREGSSGNGVLLLFLQKGREPEFYVRDAQKAWSYFLGEEAIGFILKRRQDFVVVPTPTPTPFPTPRPGT